MVNSYMDFSRTKEVDIRGLNTIDVLEMVEVENFESMGLAAQRKIWGRSQDIGRK
jgi:hypothetical protein